MGQACLSRRVLALGIVTLFLGASWMAVLSGNVSVMAVGATIYVDNDNTDAPWDGSLANPYQNITSGLAHASDGNTVYVFGGTYYENVVANKSVTLVGDSKPVINGTGGSRGIDITVNNVTVSGFNITNSEYGIFTNASGFSIANNVFWYDTNGFFWDISESSLAEDYTLYDCVIKSNEFFMSSSYNAVSASVSLDYGFNSGYDVAIGDVAVCENTFHMDGTGAEGIYDRVNVQNLYGGTVSVGVLNVSENEMYGGSYGIDFYGYLNGMKNVQASVGDFIVNDNMMVNQSSGGMTIDYYNAINWNGTIGTFRDLVIDRNTITSVYASDAIYVADYAYWYWFYGDTLLEVGNLYIEENEIDVGGEGIFVYYSFGAYDFYDTASVVMQNANIRYNMIYGASYGIDVEIEDFYYLYDDSSATMGDMVVTGNTINSTDDGIYFYVNDVGYEMYGNSSLVIGDFILNDNTINSSSEGIYVYEFYEIGSYMYENSSFVMGSIQFNDNTIDSDSYGIYLDAFDYFGSFMYGTSSSVMGNIELTGNEIVSENDGIHIQELGRFGYAMEDKATSTMNNLLVNENTVNSDWYGIGSGSIRYFGSSLDDNSSFTMGNIEFCRNTVNSTTDALGFSQFTDFGTSMYGNSSFSMGNVLVDDNTLYSYIWLTNFGRFGAELYENSSCTIGNVEFCRNAINSVGRAEDGITFNNLLSFGYEMYNYSSFIMGDFSVSSNTIVADGDRFGIAVTQGSGGFGINVYDNASAVTGNFEFAGNYINFTRLGFNLWMVKDAIIRGNTIQNSTDIGIYLPESVGNRVYHNNIINNTAQALVTPNYNNTWDNGYPSGGNYWSNYSGNDHYEGPSQNIPGNDTIGDTPYEVNVNNTDRYPLMAPYEPLRPLFLESEGRWNMGEVDFEVRSVFAADVDADGAVEIMTCAQVNQSGELRIYDYDGLTITLERVEVWSSTDGDTRAWSVYAADVEGDGVTEILTGAETYNGQNNVYYDGQLRIWTWNGTTLTLEHSEEWHTGNNTHVYSVFAYDVDDDGKVEIITGGDAYDAGNNYICEFRVWSWNGTDLTLEASEEWRTGWGEAVWSVRALDVDGDGVVELLTAGEDDSQAQLRIWTWNGTMLTMEHSEEWTLGGWMDRVISVFASDIDNDGVVEVVTGGDAYDSSYVENGQLRVWTRNGSSLALESNIDWPLNGTYAYVWTVCPGDVDRDGVAEIITAGAFGSGAQLRVWSFDGLTLKLDASQESVDEWADTVFAWDVDGDGTTEIITAGYTYDAMYGYEQVKIWSFPESIPPTITIMSPENKTYSTSTIPLTFTVNEPATWIAYSLNGQANVTITGNTNLPILPDGWHHVTIYANDTFDNMGFATVYFTVDTAKPSITNVVQDPLNNIQPNTVVKISATVTDATSGIKQVLLNCTFNNSTKTWHAELSMTHLTGDIWNATIPPQTYGTNATYVIIAEDNAGNTITTEQIYGYKYEYAVVSEFPLSAAFLIFVIATLLMAVALKKKGKCTQP